MKSPRQTAFAPAAVSAAAVVLGFAALVVAFAFGLKQQAELAPPPPATPAELRTALPGAAAKWRLTEAKLVRRLHQRQPLELGKVWVTRKGRVCGLVNGRDSFGGLTSMVRFYYETGEPVFAADHANFNDEWVDCKADHFVTVHAGSDLEGFCGSAEGRKRCVTVGG